METRIPNGTRIIDKRNNRKLKIVDAIETNNQFGYGVYLYRFEGMLDNGFGLYRNEFDVLKRTKVISAFPACGKSYVYKNKQNCFDGILDSDSSDFSWVKDANGNNTKERNPNFPDNYIQHIKDNIGKVEIIFVSSHDVVRKALEENNIDYTLVYPDKALKQEWLWRFKQRGNDHNFIDFINTYFDEFIDDMEKETFPKKVKLPYNYNKYLDVGLLIHIMNYSEG